MKAYRGVDGRIRIFRPEMNMHRMNVSAKRSGLPTFDGVEFTKCLSRLVSIDQEWVPHTEAASLYLRPTLIGIDVSTQWIYSFKGLFSMFTYYSQHWVWHHPIQRYCIQFFVL